MEVLVLFGNGSATADNVASVQASRSGTIIGSQISAYADADADGENAQFELSLVPYGQFSTNDAQGPFCYALIYNAASGTPASLTPSSVNFFAPTNIPIPAGQRIYMNAAVTVSTVSFAFHAVIHVR